MSSSNGSQADIRAPIHRLHVELLISILYDARSQLKDTCLTHVCRSWRSLLFDMPEFWVSTLQQTVIYLGGRPLSEQLKQYLTLSAPRSLRLLISVHSDGWHEREVLRPYASRIVEVVAAVGICGFDNDSEGFMELLKESPNLARLHLELNSGTVKSRLHNYFNDHLSNLPHLHVDFKSLPTPSCANTCLTTLMIEILPYAIPELAAKLRLFQRLNFLTVDLEPVQRWASPETLEVPMLPSSDEEIINLPSLTHLSMRATTSAAICTLYRLRWFHPRACLTLLDLEVSDEHIDLLPIFGAPTVLRQHILPSIVHLYLGRTRKRRHVRLLGYDRSDVVRLEISLWREKRGSSHDVLANILRPFEPVRGIASLAFDLPNLPVALLRGPWGQSWGSRELDGIAPPPALDRIELLGRTPGATKLRFARWVAREGHERNGNSPYAPVTLCWVVDVAREQACENRARAELESLRLLLEELNEEGRRVRRLELYGTLQSWVVATRVGQVSTYTKRCLEVLGPFVPRFEDLVDELPVV